jgi:hypothetical protein
VRLFVVLALVVAAPALACPLGARCVREVADVEEAPAARKPISLDVHQLEPPPAWKFDRPKAKPDDAMPWIWQQLRRSVYEQLPRYRDDALTFVLSPVVVAGSFDTVPGFGIAGDF